MRECPGCDKKFRPFYQQQVYCDKCRDGENEFDRDCDDLNFKAWE